jgi:hypothetical protein
MKKIKSTLFIYIISFFFYLFNSAQAASVLEVKEDDFIIGDKSAPITVIEYLSLSCNH